MRAPAQNRQLLYGHTWEAVQAVAPCLLCAMKIREPADIRIRRIIHNQWALDYPYTAGLEVRARTTSARWQTRPAHVAHLYPPATPYWERRSAKSYPRIHDEVYVLFQDTDRLRFLIDRRIGYARFLDTDGTLGKMLSEVARMGTVFGEKGFWKGQAILCGIMDLLLTARRIDENTWRLHPQNGRNGLTDFTRAVDTYLREHVSERVTLADIARYAHVSDSTLSHRYHAETGQTPMETLMDMRLTIAKGLLMKGWKLEAIAAQTGFSDAFHLSRAFKRATGMPPKSFRAALRGQPS